MVPPNSKLPTDIPNTSEMTGCHRSWSLHHWSGSTAIVVPAAILRDPPSVGGVDTAISTVGSACITAGWGCLCRGNCCWQENCVCRLLGCDNRHRGPGCKCRADRGTRLCVHNGLFGDEGISGDYHICRLCHYHSVSCDRGVTLHDGWRRNISMEKGKFHSRRQFKKRSGVKLPQHGHSCIVGILRLGSKRHEFQNWL